MRLPAFVCLFVHLSVYEQDYSKTRACIWMKCCMSTIVGTWTNWLTFEPDPDYSPDAGISHISYALQRGILLCRENPTYAYWRGRSLQRGVVLKRYYSPRTVETPLSEVRALYRVPSTSSFCRTQLWQSALYRRHKHLMMTVLMTVYSYFLIF